MFGKAVLAMRKVRLSTEGLAEQSGIPLILLGRIENGIASGDEWGLSKICAVAGVLDVTPDKLMERWAHYIEEAGGAWWETGRRKD